MLFAFGELLGGQINFLKYWANSQKVTEKDKKFYREGRAEREE